MTLIDDMIAVIGTGRISALYHRSAGVVSSAGNLVTWDDYRGSGGPTLLPNGGSGGTAPTVDTNYVITDGAASYVRHSNATGALAAYALTNTSSRALVLWGELTPTGNTYWPLAIDSDAGANLCLIKRQPLGAKNQTNLFNSTNIAPKLLPASGVRSLFVINMPAHYGITSADPGGTGEVWMHGPIGRAPLMEAQGPYTPTTGFISLGKYSTAFGAMKIRGFMWVSDVLGYADMAAIETMAQLDGCDLYNQSDSAGLIFCIGDSLTHGLQSTNPSTTVPVDVAGTGYPSHLQRLINQTSRQRIDVVNRGTPSINGTDASYPQPGHATSYVQDMAAFGSPGRLAAGLSQIAIVWYGANDMSGVGPGDLAKAVGKDVQDLHLAGFKVVVYTVIPQTGWFGGVTETKRLAYNNLVRANPWGADLILDLATVLDGATAFWADPVGSDTITTNTTYYNADGIHGTNLSYQRLGEFVFAKINAARFFDPVTPSSRSSSTLRPKPLAISHRAR